MASAGELAAMRLAIALSAHGLGTTSPNPPVGCVILDPNGDIAGTGYHQRKGEPHAETHALNAAAGRAAGGTAVVTLEPCNHVGRTPACRQSLLDAGVARVVIALLDPTSRGDGGAAVLRAAGVDVEVGVLADEAQLVLGPWVHAVHSGRPFVTAGYTMRRDRAQKLDRAKVTQLRTTVDAVLYGNGRVEEGIAESHGQGVLTLPASPLLGTPAEGLVALHAGGVRLLLLATELAIVRDYVAADLVDRLVLYLELEGHGGGSPDRPEDLVPPRYQVIGIAGDLHRVRIDCTAAPGQYR